MSQVSFGEMGEFGSDACSTADILDCPKHAFRICLRNLKFLHMWSNFQFLCMTDVAFNNNTEKIDGKRGHLKHFLHADLDQQQIECSQ